MNTRLEPSAADPDAIKQLILTARRDEWKHDFPTAVDLDELFQDAAMARCSRLWLNGSKEPCAYAFVHFPYNNLTFEAREEFHTDQLEDEVIAWAQELMRARYGADLRENTLDSSCRAEDERALRFLTRHGFERQELESLAYGIHLDSPPIPHPPPSGYRIRPLRDGEAEAALALHQQAFDSRDFTLAERLAMMNTEAYLPELDLLAVAPDGSLAGGCVCGIEQLPGEGLPEGYTDPVYVHPDHQGKGIATALLRAGLAGLYARGARTVRLGTSSENLGMQRAAQAAGFTCVSRRLWFSRGLSI